MFLLCCGKGLEGMLTQKPGVHVLFEKQPNVRYNTDIYFRS